MKLSKKILHSKPFSLIRSILSKYIKLSNQALIKEFHKFYYNSGVWKRTYFLGIRILKNPLDLWQYQEMIFKIKPDIIIDCGTAEGGSALYYATICDLINKGRVVTIDIVDNDIPKHPRIIKIVGDTTSDRVIKKIEDIVKGKKIIVFLDSDHHKDHVLKELNIYSKFITEDSYLVVEDTNINNNPVLRDFGPGPMEAVEKFLKENNDFKVDISKEKFYLTFNPKGYLKRK